MHLEPIPAFEDNYIWAVHDGQSALFVDPGEAAPILSWLEQRRMTPAAALITHHHSDHCGGLGGLLDRYPIPVYGPSRERITGVDHPVGEGMTCHIPRLDLDFTVLDVPGHTPGHIAFLGHGWLFCGDTLFSCGCGKTFGGTLTQLHASLERLAALPADTLACCAHEYTLDNIRFAEQIDPENSDLLAWKQECTLRRAKGEPTLPVAIGDEIRRNPFLGCRREAVRAGLARLSGLAVPEKPDAVFSLLRQTKDRFDSNSL